MRTAKALQAVRKRLRVSRDQRVEIGRLPFQPGSEVEVIVVGQGEEQSKGEGEKIYEYIERLKKKSGIPHYTLKEIERIIHQSRRVGG